MAEGFSLFVGGACRFRNRGVRNPYVRVNVNVEVRVGVNVEFSDI